MDPRRREVAKEDRPQTGEGKRAEGERGTGWDEEACAEEGGREARGERRSSAAEEPGECGR